MKKSTWRFKRSLFIKRSPQAFLRHDLPYALSLLAILVVASCQLSHKGEIDASQPVDAGAQPPLALKPPLAPPLADVEEGKTEVLLVDDAKHVVAEASVSSCSAAPEAVELRLRTQVASDFGSQALRMTVRGSGAGETVRAEIEGYRLSFSVTTPVKVKLVQQACAARTNQASEIVVDKTAVDALHDWVELVAPDCDKITLATAGDQTTASAGAAALADKPAGTWRCKLPSIVPEAAGAELNGIQTTMIRRWSRQPYLLARRLAVGVTLAQALETNAPEKHLDTFCKIVLNSLPVELPATLASKRWQAAVCGKETPHRIDAAKFGLAKTLAEVDFMRELFERTSRLGFLSLRIPAAQAPGRDVLVSLTPEEDVVDNLARETARMWLADGNGGEATPDDMPRACWHPVFAEDTALLNLARQLAMAGEAARVVCEEPAPSKSKAFVPERYFAESVTSETEFVLPNGRSKTLRLPIGRYSYTLRSLPENPEDWDDASQTGPHAAGEIVWDNKRPRPIITSW